MSMHKTGQRRAVINGVKPDTFELRFQVEVVTWSGQEHDRSGLQNCDFVSKEVSLRGADNISRLLVRFLDGSTIPVHSEQIGP